MHQTRKLVICTLAGMGFASNGVLHHALEPSQPPQQVRTASPPHIKSTLPRILGLSVGRERPGAGQGERTRLRRQKVSIPWRSTAMPGLAIPSHPSPAGRSKLRENPNPTPQQTANTLPMFRSTPGNRHGLEMHVPQAARSRHPDTPPTSHRRQLPLGS
jgi:hypothetical protein